MPVFTLHPTLALALCKSRHLGHLQVAGRSLSDDTPSTTLTAIEPCSDNGCSAKVRAEPPTSTLAPAPMPRPRSPVAPTYSPDSAPGVTPDVGANTPQPRTLPALTPRSRPTVLMAPS